MSGVRLDKWLWAARFFKTRAKAKDAIDGGKVHLGGHRCKPSKEVVAGDMLNITQGFDEKIIIVHQYQRNEGLPPSHKSCIRKHLKVRQKERS